MKNVPTCIGDRHNRVNRQVTSPLAMWGRLSHLLLTLVKVMEERADVFGAQQPTDAGDELRNVRSNNRACLTQLVCVLRRSPLSHATTEAATDY